jgi:hypothetical protein
MSAQTVIPYQKPIDEKAAKLLQMTRTEYATRRFIIKEILGSVNYFRARLSPFQTTAQIEGFPARRPQVWKISLSVTYSDWPEPFQIVEDEKPTGKGK